MKILVIDVGGTHVKMRASGQRNFLEIPSGPQMTPKKMAAEVRKVRPPEPYKGKGILYRGERIRRKAGKTGKTAGAAK